MIIEKEFGVAGEYRKRPAPVAGAEPAKKKKV
jgi:hypothetical protein